MRAYGEWLGRYPWNLWCTLTFRFPPTAPAALRAWGRWANYCTKEQIDTWWWVATEEGKHFGRVHLHALIGSREPPIEGSLEPLLFLWWTRRYGRAHTRRYDPDRGASFYIAKYVTKELGEWQLGGKWPEGPASATAGEMVRIPT